jgi:fido (protein-threonine AMPylation protein)
MDHNGEAIHGSMPWHITEEKHELSGRIIHFTTKGNAVHVFCPVNGRTGELTIKALSAEQLAGHQIASVAMLGSEKKVQWSQEAGGLKLTVPAESPGGFVSTFRVDLRTQP